MKQLLLLLLLSVLVASQECRPEFASWLESHGAVLSPQLSLLDLTVSGDNAGTLVTIPRKLFLMANATQLHLDYPQLAVMTAEGRWWDDRNNAFAKFRLEDMLLTLQLVKEVELGTDSLFYEYIIQLPQDLNQVHEYTNDDLMQFRHPGLIAVVKKMASRMKEMYSKLFPPTTVSDKQRQALFVWANGIVRSRAFSNGKELMLIPLVDRFDFAVGMDKSNAKLDVSEDYCTILWTNSTAGKVLLPNAWLYSNLFILLHRGVVFPENEWDAFPINLPPLTDPWANKRIDKLKQDHLWPVLVPSLSPPHKLVGFFRVAMATGERELEMEGLGSRAMGGPALEEVALTACVRQLDSELLVFLPVTDNGSRPRQLAKQYVDSQRELLTRAKTYCQLALQVAQAFPDDDDENETPGEYLARFETEITHAMDQIALQVYGKNT
ncbi:hypothetical protein BASA81_004488 [Batrachochytrium salamandrivorans]|nr:hypothetical protein BASA81_004488 [Batrachochytrium salamandrivorans]